MKTKKILLVGGGTGGHLFPLQNLTQSLLRENCEVHILVSDSLLDRKILADNFDVEHLHFHYLKTGKIRRYFSWQNFKDFFQIFRAIFWCRELLKTHQFDRIFLKGGFVGFPLLISAKLFFPRFKGKIFSHESDISPGALTKFATRFSDQVFYSFGEESYPLFYSSKSLITKPQTVLPQILVLGGSQGAQFINDLIIKCQDKLLSKYKVIIISGINKKINLQHKNFQQFEFLEASELAKKIKESDLVLSRGGANSLFEIIAAQKPSIIIPLPSAARNHQMKNAQYFETKNLVKVLEQNNYTKDQLLPLIETTLQDKPLKDDLAKSNIQNKAEEIAKIILK